MVRANNSTEYVGIVDESLEALEALTGGAAAGLLPADYDRIDLTYNADGDIETVTYGLEGAVVGILTLTYTAGRLTRVVRS